MCSVRVCVDLAVRWLMEIQTDGQRNLLELNAAGILCLSPHMNMTRLTVDLTANDKSCTITICLMGVLMHSHITACRLQACCATKKSPVM